VHTVHSMQQSVMDVLDFIGRTRCTSTAEIGLIRRIRDGRGPVITRDSGIASNTAIAGVIDAVGGFRIAVSRAAAIAGAIGGFEDVNAPHARPRSDADTADVRRVVSRMCRMGRVREAARTVKAEPAFQALSGAFAGAFAHADEREETRRRPLTRTTEKRPADKHRREGSDSGRRVSH
jgi:hypothetical protein